ncbi:tail tube protein [uncultured Caudovirales phage]|uniref:Tail tube protein n=1 Tax=uncultured Caudovirales phage TaxID=2100421 RepID=A0A6J7WW11_9CAUD|nr:tail tube protein [uncultured Caudovirales phage]
MTTFNVERFKSALTNGGARPNQFAVQLSFPTYVASQSLAVARAPFLVSVAELPGQTVNPAIVQYRGREVKFVGDRVYAPWTITVLNDAEMSIRTAFEQWMGGMEDYATKVGRLQPSEYQRDMQVFQLDRNGNALKSYNIVNAFPVDLSPVALDFGANDQVSSFTVTFQYQHFTTSNNPAGGIVNFGGIFNR